MDRDEEVQQYVKAYQHPDYKMGQPRKQAVRNVLSRLDGTLLDVGTGRGETLDMAFNLGLACTGTEVVPYLCEAKNVVQCYSRDLPFPDDSYDHVTCFDVMEHLIEEDLIPSIQEMIRVAIKTVTISASETSHRYRGRELHISKRSRAAWRTMIELCIPKGSEIIDMPTCGGSPCFQIHLPQQD